MLKLKIAFALFMAIGLAGCSWQEVEDVSGKVQNGVQKVEIIGDAVSPYTGGYGGLVAVIAGAVGTAAGALSAFAKNKKIKAVSQAAVEAADTYSGGGQAIVNAAGANGVSSEIRTAYNNYIKG